MGAALLKTSEVNGYVARAQKGDAKARERLVRAFEPFMCKMIYHCLRGRRPRDYEDILQECRIGLLRAIDRFDPRKDVLFSTYAQFWLKAAILNWLPRNAYPVRFTTKTARAVLANPDLDVAEVAAKAGCSELEAHNIRQIAKHSVSLDAPIEADYGRKSFLQFLAAPQADDGVDSDTAEALAMLLKTLDRRTRVAVEGTFLKGKTLEEVGKGMGLTRERVRQIRERGLQQLQKKLATVGFSSL